MAKFDVLRGMPVMWSLLSATILAGFMVGVALEFPQTLDRITGPAARGKAASSFPEPFLRLPWTAPGAPHKSGSPPQPRAGRSAAESAPNPVSPGAATPPQSPPSLAPQAVAAPVQVAPVPVTRSLGALGGVASVLPPATSPAPKPSSPEGSSAPTPSLPAPPPHPTPQAGPPGQQNKALADHGNPGNPGNGKAKEKVKDHGPKKP